MIHSYSVLSQRLKTMKLSSFIASRPVLVFVFLAFVALLVPSIVIPCWYKTTKRIEHSVGLATENLRLGLVSEIETIGRSLLGQPTNSPAVGLAKVLESSLSNYNNHQRPSFSVIKTKIAPILFQAYSVIPQVSQVSYIGLDGLFFSFFMYNNRTFAIFSNNTFSSNSSANYTWYEQSIHQTTGNLIGEAVKSQPLDIIGKDWFRGALGDNNTDGYYASLGTGLGKMNESLFLNTVSLFGKEGVVSLEFPVKTLIDASNRLNLHGGDLYLLTTDGKMLLQGSRTNVSLMPVASNTSVCFRSSVLLQNHGGNTDEVQSVPCNNTAGNDVSATGDPTVRVYCSFLQVAGVPLVQALMFPDKGETTGLVAKNSKTALTLLVLTATLSMISILSFVMLMVRAAKREMHLCSTLINQMEATQQAERKSMNKSKAFAQASHDIKNELIAITGLVELCYPDAEPGSDLEKHLKGIQGCTAQLFGLLNSVLDMSKIEAGKMQLEEEEFNLAELLEEVIDSSHPLRKTGVDMVLDPHDGTILRFANVQGDRGKLRQILTNLVSNAVKFTSQGHVSIRAWARKPSSQSSIILASDSNPKPNPSGSFSRFLPRLFCQGKESRNDMETVHSIRRNVNTMEFVFEVDDTGKGIPKEKQKSVFENYVRLKGGDEQGTGLGLGIVQSLVRLMGGEIRIVEKEHGQKGTCFQFNVFLTTLESQINDTTMSQDIEAKGDCLSTPNLGLTIRTSNANRSLRSLSPRLNNILLSSSPKPDGSLVVLLLKDGERRRVTKKYIKGLGISVEVVNELDQLNRIKSKLCSSSPQSSIGRAESISRSEISSSSSKELPMSAMDGTDQITPLYKRRNNNATRFALLVIDASAWPFRDLYEAVEQFRGALHHGVCCKVVWLNKPRAHETSGDDVSFLKPLHGSRLIQVMKMLPEFGGTMPKESAFELQREPSLRHSFAPEGSSKGCPNLEKKHLLAPKHKKIVNMEMQGNESSSEDKNLGTKIIRITPPETEDLDKMSSRNSVGAFKQVAMAENKRITEPSDRKCLKGKKVLIVDDNKSFTLVAKKKLLQQGAVAIDICYNGAEAVSLFRERFREQSTGDCLNTPPFDYIFMDCQMPEMDGYEATRQIREEESHYGMHIPIIGITVDGPHSKEASRATQSGMDVHLGKELVPGHLAKAIRDMDRKRI